ncbi:C-terminal processing protease CtpA/Prc [Roseimicrobium gellanilyticum]|uniref:C-terminal processing protease CtpA/Prc n=1 Tax=Roseimicrobium gellanilyticum TaxID=748857 RepID=A0A366H0U3_9BACT|nr:S41 family peptidase [Roseimicrobium gellanilyticum]RBP35320.1 C-terminal processing protease CtpA/Prc [Roseimicrobium gellanilyticum]
MNFQSTFIAVGLMAAHAVGAQETPRPYEADVAFLLKEFEAKAGPLLKKKGVDWAAVKVECTRAAKNVKTDEEHLKLVMRLIGQLRDGHAGIRDSKVKWPDESQGRKYSGPGIMLLISEGKVYVSAAYDRVAEQGLGPGAEVVKVDGMPAMEWLRKRAKEKQDEGSGYSTDHQALYAACHWGLAGWDGTTITFETKDTATGAVKEVKLTRGGGTNFVPSGRVYNPVDRKRVGRQTYGKTAEGFGYIHLRDVPDDLPQQLDQMLKDLGDVPGLILDVRANGGGACDHEAVFGRFLAKGQTWKQYTGAGDHPYTGPMVVIVDAGVRSAGETIGGMFKEDGRAYMIGDSPTAGTSSQKTEVTTPSGLFTIRYSVASNMGRFNAGRGIEGIGVPPHEIVPMKAEDLRKKEDTEVKRAVELLQKGFPKGVVEYQHTVKWE